MNMLRLASLTIALAFAESPAWAQDRPATNSAVSYCAELKRVVVLALTKERFSTIAGNPREGSFFNTTLQMPGWKDCSLYGSRTYTCDSQDLVSADQAMERQANIVAEIKGCLGDGWAEDPERASPSYTVVRSSRAPVSITISTGRSDSDGHVVRLTVFPRTGN